MSPRPSLVGIGEIAKMLGVSRQRAQQIAEQRDFPKPLAVLSAGRIWRTKDILSWAERRGRDLHPLDGED